MVSGPRPVSARPRARFLEGLDRGQTAPLEGVLACLVVGTRCALGWVRPGAMAPEPLSPTPSRGLQVPPCAGSSLSPSPSVWPPPRPVPPRPKSSSPRARSQFPVVTLTVNVRDRASGKRISGLSREAFSLREDMVPSDHPLLSGAAPGGLLHGPGGRGLRLRPDRQHERGDRRARGSLPPVRGHPRQQRLRLPARARLLLGPRGARVRVHLGRRGVQAPALEAPGGRRRR